MEFIIGMIIPIAVCSILAVLRSPRESAGKELQLPKLILILGIIITAFFLVILLLAALSDAPILALSVFLLFSLIGCCLIIAFLNCRISYDENGFTVRSFFRVTKSYSYSEITAIRNNPYEYYIYVGKRKVMVDEFMIGGSEFIAYAKKQYRIAHDGKAIPTIQKSKKDIFNGNVADAGGCILAYVLVAVLIIVSGILAVWKIYLSPCTESNTQNVCICFSDCSQEDGEIILTASDNELYKITPLGKDFDTSKIASLCDGNTVLTAYFEEITPKNEESYRSVKAVVHGDTFLLSFDETNEWHKEEYFPLIIIIAVFAVVWGLFVAASIKVGRNPGKYSKKVIHLFFKPGQVKF